ncbi:tetratricopeptide repeat protein [Spirosoma soli]|uniref:Tetratricopeptide repeat protein n=1 Tax=Spirosoma soli TaxID=1770529 RepID=A0ABW5M3U0_9BACT
MLSALKRWGLFAGLFLLSFFSRAQVMTDPAAQQTVLKALDAIYNFEFMEAEGLIRQLQARYPQHPIGPILRATQLELQYLPLHENKVATTQFIQAANQGLELARKLLAKREDDPEGVFFALTAHSYLASLYNNQGESMKAVSESKKSYSYLKDGFTLMDKSPDFYFTTGLYNYYVERYPMDHPIVRPFMIFFDDGDMGQGLKQMDTATKRGLFMRAGANYYLAHILLKHEIQPNRAVTYTKYLADKYPNNPLFGMVNVEALLLAGRYADARPYLQRLKQMDNKLVPMAVNTFEGMLAEYADKNDREAAESYQTALKQKYNDPYTKEYHAFAYAGLARIAARANDPNRAKINYKKALTVAQYKGVIKEAKAYK